MTLTREMRDAPCPEPVKTASPTFLRTAVIGGCGLFWLSVILYTVI